MLNQRQVAADNIKREMNFSKIKAILDCDVSSAGAFSAPI